MNQTNNKEPPESAVKVQSAPCEDSRGTELQTIPESRYAPPYTAHDGNLCRAIASKSGIVYMALQRMNENILVSVTTDIASIVADLSVLFDNRRPIEDCTTILPQKKERKHQAWEIKI